MHVVLRVLKDVPRLRQERVHEAIRGALAGTLGRTDFRVVHTSIQHNHLHFLVEAEHTDALTAGMQGLAISAARAINRDTGHHGKVFAFRYHMTPITSPRQMRNTLAYVLNNWRRHSEDTRGSAQRRATLDPYSTALSFDGWTLGRFAIPDGHVPLPSATSTSWLLSIGWRIHGELDPRARPGPL